MTAVVILPWECGWDIAAWGVQDRKSISRLMFGGDTGMSYDLLIYKVWKLVRRKATFNRKICTKWIGPTFLLPSPVEVHGQVQAA